MGSVIKSACIQAIIFFILAMLSSVIQSLLLANTRILKIFGGVLLVVAVIIIGLHISNLSCGHNRSEAKWTLIISFIFALVAGILYLTMKNTFHNTDSFLNKICVYTIEIAGICFPLCLLIPFLTKLLMGDTIKAAEFDYTQESGLYISFFALISFAQGIVFASKNSSNIWGSVFPLSIINCCIAAILGAFVGYTIENKSSPLATAYVSNYDTTNVYDSTK